MTIGPTKPTPRTVLCQESPRITMVNPLPPGAKGLAASRWATPAEPTHQTKPASTKPALTKPAPTTVLYKETPRVTTVNKFPPGAKGLAASRWATSAEPTPQTKPATPTAARVLCQEVPKVTTGW
ncbi:hypothetical protein V8F33_014117 [Rhypophila sp. PSN 637]